MGNYKMRFVYQTGGSFGSHQETTELEITWDDINLAKQNLVWIKEHYQMVSELNSYKVRRNKLTKEEIIEKNKDKEWFVLNKLSRGNIDMCAAEGSIKLKIDNGNIVQIGSFWIGHFEHLESVEIFFEDKDLIFIPD
jgi:hypothetical protein